MKRVRATPIPGRPGFRAVFRHPNGKLITLGLDTRDKNEADAIAAHITEILNDSTLQNEKDPRLLSLRPKAIAAFFGKDSDLVKRVEGLATSTNPLEGVEIEHLADEVKKHATREIKRASAARDLGIPADISRGIRQDNFEVELVQRVLASIPFKKWTDLQTENRTLRDQLTSTKEKLEATESELREIRTRFAVNRKETLADCVAKWKPEYKKSVKRKTYVDATSAVDALAGAIGSTRMVEIKSAQIREHLLESKTLARANKRLRYVKSFWSWAVMHYELPTNVAKLVSIKVQAQESVRAITVESDFKDYLNAFKSDPYWHTWTALACLAGPRFAEQCKLTLDNVTVDELRISAGKTGRFRRVPVERTYLRPLLKHYLSNVRPALGDSPWLFPTLLPKGTKRNTVTQEGQWSPAGFTTVWKQAAKASGTPTDFSARCHRHQFGTTLGALGMSSLEISRQMGNTEDIARRFYVAVTTAGKRWAFAY